MDRDPHIKRIHEDAQHHELRRRLQHMQHVIWRHMHQEQHEAFQRDDHRDRNKQPAQPRGIADAKHRAALERDAAVHIQLPFVPQMRKQMSRQTEAQDEHAGHRHEHQFDEHERRVSKVLQRQ